MRTRLFGRFGAHAFGTFGLLLVLLVGELAQYESALKHTYPERARAWLGRRAMDGIGAIGWLVDRLAPPAGGSKRQPRSAGAPVNARTVSR
jgi:hypothetical protein